MNMNMDGIDNKEKMKIGCLLGTGQCKTFKRRGPPKSFLYDNKMVDFYMKNYTRGALRRKRRVQSALA